MTKKVFITIAVIAAIAVVAYFVSMWWNKRQKVAAIEKGIAANPKANQAVQEAARKRGTTYQSELKKRAEMVYKSTKK